jgi:hypothetical protein
MAKGGLTLESSTLQNFEGLIGSGNKKCKLEDGSLAEFMDVPLSEALKDQADVYLLRCVTVSMYPRLNYTTGYRFLVYGNIPWRSAASAFLKAFCNTLQPSYAVPSPYVLSGHVFDAEITRVHCLEVGRLQKSKFNTLLIDGWEDKLRHALAGCVAARVNDAPSVLGLNDMSGSRVTADGYLDAALKSLDAMDIQNGRHLIAITTDNPTVMQAFR